MCPQLSTPDYLFPFNVLSVEELWNSLSGSRYTYGSVKVNEPRIPTIFILSPSSISITPLCKIYIALWSTPPEPNVLIVLCLKCYVTAGCCLRAYHMLIFQVSYLGHHFIWRFPGARGRELASSFCIWLTNHFSSLHFQTMTGPISDLCFLKTGKTWGTWNNKRVWNRMTHI